MISPNKLLKSLNKRPSKKLGQHFLVHEHSVEKIMKFADVGREDVVLEVGPGLGALTVPLAKRVRKLYAVEVDTELVKLLKERVVPEDLKSRIEIIEADILKVDICSIAQEAGKKLRVFGNLPYNISSPVLFKLWENHYLIEDAVFMLQTEVAERLVAKPGTKDYGILTVLLAYRGDIRKGFTLKPEEFYPVPKVGSMVIKIGFNKKPQVLLAPPEEKLFVKLVKTSFGQRRKMLRKSLLRMDPGAKEFLPKVFERSGVSPEARPETLSVEDFCRLAKEMSRVIMGK